MKPVEKASTTRNRNTYVCTSEALNVYRQCAEAINTQLYYFIFDWRHLLNTRTGRVDLIAAGELTSELIR